MKARDNKPLREEIERMHLQWFSDAAEEDVEIEDEPDDEDDIPILLEGRDEIPAEAPVEDAGPTREDLERELTELRAAKAGGAATPQPTEDGFRKLADLLESRNPAPSTPQQQETWNDLKARLKDKFYDDPMAAIEESLRFAIRTEVAPAFQQTQDMVSKTALSSSRQVAEANPTNKIILEKYRGEVDEAVKALPPGPDIYERACQQVGMQHFTDILSLQVEETLSNRGVATTPSKPTSNVSPGGAASRAPGGKVAPRRILTKEQQRQADVMGLDYKDAWYVFNTKT